MKKQALLHKKYAIMRIKSFIPRFSLRVPANILLFLRDYFMFY